MKKCYLVFGIMATLLLTNTSYSQNNALNFDGVNDFVQLNGLGGQLQNDDSFTIEFWMRANIIGQPSFPVLFAINTNLPSNAEQNILVIQMLTQSGVNDGQLYINWENGGNNEFFNTQTQVGDNVCHHIAYTRNGTGPNSSQIFIDGLLMGSFGFNDVSAINAASFFSLGQEFDAGIVMTPSQFYNGTMDDVRIWTAARTQAQIQANMNLQLIGNEPNLLALYNCNQGIASGLNTGITNLTNSTATPGLNGVLSGFTMNGLTSNFISDPCATGNCNEIDSLYVAQNSNITTNTTWSGKIFVPDNTVLIVDNAVLDITNVDIVFGQCAGIDFVNGAIMRANNSVFRPCNLDDTWRGLSFDGTSAFSHQVNENTFKNAEIALLFENNADAVINSNTFSNCNEGITMNGSFFTESIFGNNFVTNNAFPEFANCYLTTTPTDIIHIHGIGVSNEVAPSTMSITQNNFTLSNTNPNIRATGVDLLNSRASISENTMTNMENGIVINAPTASVFIEGNEIEYNYQFRTVQLSVSQISVFNSNGVFVSINNNELRNSINSGYVSNGIYLESSNNSMVQNNQLEGFRFGINTRSVSSVNFTENELSSISGIGIYLDNVGVASRNFITCNDITMVMGVGTSISTFNCSNRTRITSNCLKDGNTGIRLQGQGMIPVIRNNFIYNYRTGINNIGHSGSIGTVASPGMNTLWSNVNTALDVASSTPITIANNFGQSNCTWATVAIQGNNALHSTASCALQITSANAVSQGSLNTSITCDNLNQFLLPTKKIGNTIVLPSSSVASDYLNTSSDQVNTMIQLVVLEECDESYVNQLLETTEISENDQNLVWYAFYKANHRLAEASGVLQHLIASEFNHFVSVEKMILKKLSGENLTQGDFSSLTDIMNQPTINNGIYNLAVGLTKTGQAHGTYRIVIPTEIDSELNSNNTDWIKDELTALEVYPNPSSSEIFIQILEGKNVAGQVIQIYDLFGSKVLSAPLDFVSGRTRFDISNLAAGSYFILLESDGVKSERTKFIKM